MPSARPRGHKGEAMCRPHPFQPHPRVRASTLVPAPRNSPSAARGGLGTVLLLEADSPRARGLWGPRVHHSSVSARRSLCSFTASGHFVHSSLWNVPVFLLYSCYTGPNSVSRCSWGTRGTLHGLAFVHVLLPQIVFFHSAHGC